MNKKAIDFARLAGGGEGVQVQREHPGESEEGVGTHPTHKRNDFQLVAKIFLYLFKFKSKF